MKALALDTTTRAGSVALVVDDVVVNEREGDASRTHAERLPRELIEVGEANDVRVSNVDLFAVAAGPGSFTGLRIGIATIQGLAFVARVPAAGISALDALAHIASADATPGSIVAAWMDAHRREVFAALYRVSQGAAFEIARLITIDPPSVGNPSAILTRWGSGFPTPGIFVGDGAMLYHDVITSHAPSARVVAPPPLAGAIGRLALAHARNGGVTTPAGIQPLYVRRPDAELDREKKA